MSEPRASSAVDAGDGAIDDDILAQVSDYLDGALAPAARAEVERKIADDPAWSRAHAELTETRNFLSGLRKAHAPERFADGVTETIHRRSAGRWFARRTLGDRVPFGVLVVLAVIGLLVIGYVLRSSSTGSLRVDPARPSAPALGSAAVLPP